ncbi:MAG: cupin domain-containing protein [Candidatus Aminicenantes bacterium]|nr:cupin domain-containing protein [Candidatus Aminicenantes bacterium]
MIKKTWAANTPEHLKLKPADRVELPRSTEKGDGRMKKTFQMSIFLIVALRLALPGRQSDAPDKLAGVKTKAEIDTLVAKIRGGKLKGAQPLFEREKGPYRIYTSFIENRKGAADLHGTDDEVFLIVSGAAEVTLGGDISDKKSTAANEFRGTTIVGGITRSAGAGDIISIPRGTAHQMNPGAGQVLYIVIKMNGSR